MSPRASNGSANDHGPIESSIARSQSRSGPGSHYAQLGRSRSVARDVSVTVTPWGGDVERVSPPQLLFVPPSVDDVRPSFFAASSGLYTHLTLSLKDTNLAKLTYQAH